MIFFQELDWTLKTVRFIHRVASFSTSVKFLALLTFEVDLTLRLTMLWDWPYLVLKLRLTLAIIYCLEIYLGRIYSYEALPFVSVSKLYWVWPLWLTSKVVMSNLVITSSLLGLTFVTMYMSPLLTHLFCLEVDLGNNLLSDLCCHFSRLSVNLQKARYINNNIIWQLTINGLNIEQGTKKLGMFLFVYRKYVQSLLCKFVQF